MMKHSVEVEIAAPRGRVVALFDDPANLMRWMPDLLKFEPVSGTPGQPGATSRLVYRAGKGQFELMETITVRSLPDEFSGTYASKMGTSWIRNRFIDKGATTRWIVDTEFKSSGVMKVLTFLMGGMIRAQNQKVINAFKTFAESHGH
ncbi:MAG: SRPBCC family protein [Candidatus Polarisedimenticolia bacterium]